MKKNEVKGKIYIYFKGIVNSLNFGSKFEYTYIFFMRTVEEKGSFPFSPFLLSFFKENFLKKVYSCYHSPLSLAYIPYRLNTLT